MLTCTGQYNRRNISEILHKNINIGVEIFISLLRTAKDIVNLHVHMKWIIKNKCTQATTYDFTFV